MKKKSCKVYTMPAPRCTGLWDKVVSKFGIKNIEYTVPHHKVMLPPGWTICREENEKKNYHFLIFDDKMDCIGRVWMTDVYGFTIFDGKKLRKIIDS